jgi:hypothetical protein
MSNNQTSLGDRFAEIAVMVLTIVALLVGWNFKASVENRSVAFEANGISAQAPKGWRQAQATGDELLRTTDLSSNGFGTTYIIRQTPVAEDATEGGVASLMTLEYGQKLTAFRVLDQREVTVNGQKAYELRYVFVESNPDLTHASAPKVVYGLDYIYLNGANAVVVSYRAEEKNFDVDLDRFHTFLESVKF